MGNASRTVGWRRMTIAPFFAAICETATSWCIDRSEFSRQPSTRCDQGHSDEPIFLPEVNVAAGARARPDFCALRPFRRSVPDTWAERACLRQETGDNLGRRGGQGRQAIQCRRRRPDRRRIHTSSRFSAPAAAKCVDVRAQLRPGSSAVACQRARPLVATSAVGRARDR